jgi:DNA-binding beta-propeller fold protein YncE
VPPASAFAALTLLATAAIPVDHFGRPLASILGLLDPAGADFGAGGRLYVVERGAHRVRVFTADHAPERAFGARGSGNGELLRPAGIACADGLVLVGDTGNHRVVVFAEADGTFVRAFGARGSGPGQLLLPQGLALAQEQVFVADTGNDRIAVFARTGQHVRDLGGHGSGPGQMLGPLGCALDRRGGLYVADSLNHRVLMLGPDGEWGESLWAGSPRATGSLGSHPGLFDEPSGIACHDGLVYVADRLNHRIQVLDVGGEVRSIWGEPAHEPENSVGRLLAPTAVCVSPDGARAAVVEPLLGRVQIFGRTTESAPHTDAGAAAGESLVRFGPRGGGGGQLLALIDPEQRVVVVHDVRDVDPVRITTLGASGGAAQRLRAPLDCAVDAARARVLVLDGGEPRLLAFRLRRDPAAPAAFDPRMGRLERELDLRALLRDERARGLDLAPSPRSLACDAQGRIYVVDGANAAVLVLDAGLRLADVWRGPSAPVDVAPCPAGSAGAEPQVYVLDADQRTVHVFAADGERGGEPWRLVLERDRPDPLSIAWVGGRALVNLGGGELAFFHRDGTRCADLQARVAGGATFAAPGEVVPAGGHLYLIETGRGRGQVLDERGRFLTMFGH